MAEKEVQYSHARKAQQFFRESIQACMSGNLEALRTLFSDYLQQHPDTTPDDVVESFKSEGKTLIHVACSSGNAPIVDYLLDQCSSENVPRLVNLADSAGFTPLINATVAETQSVMSKLLTLGADVNAQNKDGAAAIHFAAGDGSVARMEVLLSAGANPQLLSQSGSALHWAAGKGRSEAIRLLLTKGVDVDTLSPTGLPAVLLAAVATSDESVSVLVKAGANVGYIVSGNLTLIHICAEHGLSQSVENILCVDQGRKCCLIETADGNLPIHLAAMSQHRHIVEILIPHSGPSFVSADVDQLLADGVVRLQQWHDRQQANALPPPPTSSSSAVTSTASHRELEPCTPAVDDAAVRRASGFKDIGNKHFTAKRYSQALEAYTEGIRSQGDNHALWSNRSACFLHLGQPEAALQDAEVCRRLAPDWAKGCFRLAQARLELGLYEDAAVAAFEGCKLDEANAELKELLQRAVKLGREQHAKTTSTTTTTGPKDTR